MVKFACSASVVWSSPVRIDPFDGGWAWGLLGPALLASCPCPPCPVHSPHHCPAQPPPAGSCHLRPLCQACRGLLGQTLSLSCSHPRDREAGQGFAWVGLGGSMHLEDPEPVRELDGERGGLRTIYSKGRGPQLISWRCEQQQGLGQSC